MKIAVIGCGAIGGLILGNLSSKLDVWGVVKSSQKETLEKEGLVIKRNQLESQIKVKVETRLKEPVDLAIFATKTNDLKQTIEKNKGYLGQATALSVQNGVRAEGILRDFFPEEKIISSIVMFGATFYSPNKIVFNFDGGLILGSVFGKKILDLNKVEEVLSQSFQVKIMENIKGAKYLKLFLNLNNCFAAILGKSMQEVFSDLDISKLAIELNKEAYSIVEAAQINLMSLPTYPKERIKSLVSRPSDEAAQIFSQVMVGLSKEPLYGSILQSIKRGRPSEIDFINGEIVCLAKKIGSQAPLNKKMVELVHRVEGNEFLSKEELLSEVKGVIYEK